MKFSFINDKLLYAFVLLSAVVLCGAFEPWGRGGDTIVLRNDGELLKPHEFYIADIVDERLDKSAIAWLIPVGDKRRTKVMPYPADLQGGTRNGVKLFAARQVKTDKTLRAVVITLKNFKVTEAALPGGIVEGRVSLSFSFALQGDEKPVALSDYSSNTVYKRDGQRQPDVEPLLRGALKMGFTYIDNWMNSQAGGNIKLAKAVKVSFTDYAAEPEGDTVYYSAKRPLNWGDFQSEVPGSRFEAEVFPTIGYSEQLRVENSVVDLTIALKVCLPKSACWVKATGKTDAALNHEQRHFDIAKIAGEHFKQNLAAQPLPLKNYEGIINVAYLDAYREMNRLQVLYDKETAHGTDNYQQQKWNDQIDRELKGREATQP